MLPAAEMPEPLATISKRFVRVGDGVVHYRIAGDGPAVVLMHDSPRSSRLHLDTMRTLAAHFRVFALDTPGYGNSTPIGIPNPTIPDFARALGSALNALGLEDAPLYATHTSAKIALDYAAGSERPPAMLVLDGLSIPLQAPDEAFIAAYMRPFRIDAAGAYLAAEWTRVRDMLRWFPWFDARPETRMTMAAPSGAWIEAYALDLFSAGPHYADAYAAAMRYDSRPALRNVQSPVIVAARANDVLFSSLDLIPEDRSASVAIQRLPADHAKWLEWIGQTLRSAVGKFFVTPSQPITFGGEGPCYVDLPHGQMLVHRRSVGKGRPLLILETPTIRHARHWQRTISAARETLVPELPGYGESDAIAGGSLEAYVDAIVAMLGGMNVEAIDVLSIGSAAPLAAALASRFPGLVEKVAFDGLPHVNDATLADTLFPSFAQDMAGGHLHRIWHMLRDSEVQWPWFDNDPAAQRRLLPCLAPEPLHATLLDILKQPVRYGDCARACISSGSIDLAGLRQPILLFDLAADRGYAGVADAAATAPGAQVVARSPGIEGAAGILADFLDRHAHSAAPLAAACP